MGLRIGNVVPAWGAMWPLVNKIAVLYWTISLSLLVGRLLCRLYGLGVGALLTWMAIWMTPPRGQPPWLALCFWGYELNCPPSQEQRSLLVGNTLKALLPCSTPGLCLQGGKSSGHWLGHECYDQQAEETKIQMLWETISLFLFFPALALKNRNLSPLINIGKWSGTFFLSCPIFPSGSIHFLNYSFIYSKTDILIIKKSCIFKRIYVKLKHFKLHSAQKNSDTLLLEHYHV